MEDFKQKNEELSEINIKKKPRAPRAIMVVPLVFLIIILILFIAMFCGNLDHNRIFDEGREVTAEIDHTAVGSKDDSDGNVLYYYYYLRYTYLDENGVLYRGNANEDKYRELADAEARFGEKVQIIIDGKGKSILASTERVDSDSWIVPIIVLSVIIVLGLTGIILYCTAPLYISEEYVKARDKKRNAEWLEAHEKAEKKKNLKIQKIIAEGKKPKVKKEIGAEKIILPIMILICLGMAVPMLIFAIKNSINLSTYTPIEATIVGEEEDIGDSIQFHTVYEYVVGGVTYRFTDDVGQGSNSSGGNSTPVRPPIGKKVTIYVNLDNPNDAMSDRTSNFFFIGAAIPLMAVYGLLTLAVITPKLEGKLRNPGGLFGLTMFIMLGSLVAFAPGIMNYATTLKEFIFTSPIVCIGGLIFACFGTIGFIYELTAQIKESHWEKKRRKRNKEK